MLSRQRWLDKAYMYAEQMTDWTQQSIKSFEHNLSGKSRAINWLIAPNPGQESKLA